MRIRRQPLFRSLAGIVSGLALTAITTAGADAMSFREVSLGDSSRCGGGSCATVIAVSGEITQATPAAFQAFVEQTYGGGARGLIVLFDSMGGKVVASMELGLLMRQLGAEAVVAGVASDGAGGAVLTNAQCFSACVYAFMGARKRVVPSSSQIGTHRMFMVEQSLDASGFVLLRRRRFDNGDMRSFLMHYSSEMGIDPAIIAQAEKIPSEQLHILSRAEIRRYHLAKSRP